MKKRILSLFLVLAMISTFTGCGSRQKQNTPADPAEGGTATVQTTETAESSNSLQEDETQMQEEEAHSKTNEVSEPVQPTETVSIEEQSTEQSVTDESESEEVTEKMLRMMIGDTEVAVTWENNKSVEALKELCENEPLVIRMSMYGGFEQVGSIGTRLPSNDVQTSASSGDIVLYSSNQIVVFYGSNSWAYTRLGHITDQDASGMASLLGNGDVTITISMEEAE